MHFIEKVIISAIILLLGSLVCIVVLEVKHPCVSYGPEHAYFYIEQMPVGKMLIPIQHKGITRDCLKRK